MLKDAPAVPAMLASVLSAAMASAGERGAEAPAADAAAALREAAEAPLPAPVRPPPTSCITLPTAAAAVVKEPAV